jgi:hypothetical protein
MPFISDLPVTEAAIYEYPAFRRLAGFIMLSIIDFNNKNQHRHSVTI